MTETVTIWHNPRCSKSRETLALLEENGVSPAVMLYLDTPPSVADIKTVLRELKFDDARKLMRTKEALYSELGLAAVTDQDALIQAMHDNPKLIERPIVIKGKQARLGRPPERLSEPDHLSPVTAGDRAQNCLPLQRENASITALPNSSSEADTGIMT